jgi:hypothetical protein
MSRPLRPSRRGRLAPAVLAGWLFADLLLMLALVSMSGQADPLADDEVGPSPSESTSPPDDPPPDPEPTPTGPRSVERDRVEFGVEGGERASLVRQIARQTERWAGDEAAIVLTFGGDISDTGTQYAQRVNSLLYEARPDMFPRDTTAEDFIDRSAPAQTAELWVYFYTAPE